MELGCDGVLLNTGIAGAADPLRMAHAMRLAIEAGWLAGGAPAASRGSSTRPPRAPPRARDRATYEHRPIWTPYRSSAPGAIARRLPALRTSPEQIADGPGGARADRAARPPGGRGGHGRRQELRLPGPGDPGGRSSARRRSSSRRTRSRFRSSCSARTSRSSAR